MAISYYDPTDHHPVPARPVYPTAEALRDARMQRGICSDADCSWPIDGWCVGCRAKLCERHLRDHHNQHSREYLHAQAAQTELSDADYQRMIDDEIAEEMAAEFFGEEA